MLSTLSSTNKQTAVGLHTDFREVCDPTSQTATFYEYHRYRATTYSYEALTKAAALEGAATVAAAYTRTFYVWRWSGDRWVMDRTAPYSSCVAQAIPRHDAGHLWRLEVTVDEEAVVYSATRLTDQQRDALFTACYGEWRYDL